MAIVLNVRWNRNDFEVEVQPTDTISIVKTQLKEKTNVALGKQKLLGLKTKQGTFVADDTLVCELRIKPGQKIMMLGTPDSVIEQTIKQAEAEQVLKDDADIVVTEEFSADVRERPEVQEKLQRRVEKVAVKILNPPRPGKKLLVIDIDYTVFDMGSTAERADELARPYLHFFLASCYEHFDLMIWSATSMKWVEFKMRELGVSNHADYRLVCMLDHAAMVTVQTDRYGVYDCKPLEFIWRKFPEQYDQNNTVMLDDLKRNFIMNRQNGLTIRPYKRAHQNRETDNELLRLAHYFSLIGTLDSLSQIKHRKWERYVRKAQEGNQDPTSE